MNQVQQRGLREFCSVVFSILIFVTAGLTASCGPKQTNAEKERDRVEKDNEKLRRTFAPFVGQWVGDIYPPGAEKRRALVVIELSDRTPTNPTDSEPIGRASLSATLYIAKLDDDFYGDRATRVAFFESAYDYETNWVTIASDRKNIKLLLRFKDSRLQGFFQADVTSTLDLARVSDP